MSSFKMLLMSVSLLCVTTSLSALEQVAQKPTQVKHKYGIASGIVLYDISGAAKLTEETNLSIRGTGKLRFKHWGDVLLEEHQIEVQTSGALQYKQEIKKLEQIIDNKVISVDYENEQLLEGKRSSETVNLELDTKGLVQNGEEMVAGYPCKVWRGPKSLKCLYKGVLLKHKSYRFGVSYLKVAHHVRFDINETEEVCTLPDYPLHDIGLLKDNRKTQNNKKTEELCTLINKNLLEKEEQEKKFSTQDVKATTRQTFINYISKEIFENQKKLLPKILAAMKETRVCWYSAKNAPEAEACYYPFKALKETQGVYVDENFSDWEEKGKERVLDTLEDDIIHFQSRIPCITRAKNITDLSACMK